MSSLHALTLLVVGTSALIHVSPISTIAAFCRHQSPGSASRLSTVGIAELFRLPARRPGMTSRKTWHQQNHWPHFVVSTRHTCSGSLFLTIGWAST